MSAVEMQEYWRYAPETIANLEQLLTAESSFETFEGAVRVLSQANEADDAGALWSRIVDGLLVRVESTNPRTAGKASFRLSLLVRSVHRGPETEVGRARRRILVNGCRRAGLTAEIVPLLRDMAHTSLAYEGTTALWDELIATIDERPHRWAARSSRHTFSKPAPEFARAIIDYLLSLDGSVPGLLAAEVIDNSVRHVGLTEDMRHRFRALLEHPDPDIREAARSSRTFWTIQPSPGLAERGPSR